MPDPQLLNTAVWYVGFVASHTLYLLSFAAFRGCGYSHVHFEYAHAQYPIRQLQLAMEDDTTLSHRAEVFRSKLIEDFQILECTSEEGRRKVPVYTSADIISQFCYHNNIIAYT